MLVFYAEPPSGLSYRHAWLFATLCHLDVDDFFIAINCLDDETKRAIGNSKLILPGQTRRKNLDYIIQSNLKFVDKGEELAHMCDVWRMGNISLASCDLSVLDKAVEEEEEGEAS